MVPFLAEHHGNPSGSHAAARFARRAVDDARDLVAALVGCRPGEVVFTSGGTESDAAALVGATAARPGPLVISAIEHHAVLDAVRARGGSTFRAGADGIVDVTAVPEADLVSVMLVNNELGTVQPVAEVARRATGLVPVSYTHLTLPTIYSV